MNKKLHAFVGPKGVINRMFETQQEESKVPPKGTQILLTEEQHDQVMALKNQNKYAKWENNSVTEWIAPTNN